MFIFWLIFLPVSVGFLTALLYSRRSPKVSADQPEDDYLKLMAAEHKRELHEWDEEFFRQTGKKIHEPEWSRLFYPGLQREIYSSVYRRHQPRSTVSSSKYIAKGEPEAPAPVDIFGKPWRPV